MKKVFLSTILAVFMVCLFSINVNAATTSFSETSDYVVTNYDPSEDNRQMKEQEEYEKTHKIFKGLEVVVQFYIPIFGFLIAAVGLYDESEFGKKNKLKILGNKIIKLQETDNNERLESVRKEYKKIKDDLENNKRNNGKIVLMVIIALLSASLLRLAFLSTKYD